MQESATGFELFVAIADAGSVSAAARTLGVPRETLTRQLARLEERLGVRLLHRTTRRMVPTPAGEELLGRARPLVIAAREASDAVRRLDDVPRGLLRVSVPAGGGPNLIGAVCLDFSAQHPLVQLELVATSRFVDLVAEGVDVAIRAGLSHDQSLVARRLWANELIAVASQQYALRHGLPQSLDQLAAHDCILGMGGGTRPHHRWPLREGGTIDVRGRVAVDDMGLVLLAVQKHLGIGMIPEPFARNGLRNGDLHHVLPEHIGAHTSLCVVYPAREFLLPKVRAFIDHAVHWFTENPDPDIAPAGWSSTPRRPN